MFEYERSIQPRPKLGRWAAELDELLAANAAKSAREQLTLIRIFEELLKVVFRESKKISDHGAQQRQGSPRIETGVNLLVFYFDQFSAIINGRRKQLRISGRGGRHGGQSRGLRRH